MLFILSGDIQTGKTRWLQDLVASLQTQGVAIYGVLSPGVWREHLDASGAPSYEKTGIETLFLPGMTRASFAIRRDLQDTQDLKNLQVLQHPQVPQSSQCQQSEHAKLGWAISDDAISAVNAHFDQLFLRCETGDEQRSSPAKLSSGLLVVDELGRLELQHQQGFSSAMRLLRLGTTKLYSHAIVVARLGLAALTHDQLAQYWDNSQVIYANRQNHQMLIGLLKDS